MHRNSVATGGQGAVPHGHSEADAAWFTHILRQSGHLAETDAVTAVTASPVGNGLTCDSVRFILDCSGPSQTGLSTQSLVCKFAADASAFREMAMHEVLYEREMVYYRELADRLDIRSPRCLHVAHDPADPQFFVLVLEDLGPAEAGDQIKGCTVRQAEAVIDAAAGLHAPFWGNSVIDDSGWNVRETWIPHIAATYPDLFTDYVANFGDILDDADLEIGRRFAPLIGEWFATQPRPWTLTHGDFRLDNMLLDIHGGAEPIAVVDWQTILPGPGTADIAYFLGGCLTVEDRRAHERDLLERYHGALAARGVADYGVDECWLGYRHGAFLGYFMATYAAMLVPRSDRGDTLFVTWAQRSASQIHDLDCLSLLHID